MECTDSGLIVVLQQTVKPIVVTRPQAIASPTTRTTRPYRWNTPRSGGNSSQTPLKKEVRIIFRGFYTYGTIDVNGIHMRRE